MSFGKKIEEPIKKKVKAPAERPVPEEPVLVENYGEVIRVAREKRGLDRKRFAGKMGEKESVIKRIEQQQMIPPEGLLRKIERFLGVKLTEKYESKVEKGGKRTGDLTVGDVVEIE